VFDWTTGVYWSSDSFATPMLTPARNVDELDADFWHEGINTFDRYVSEWLTLVDDAKFQATVDRIEELNPTAMVGCHTPVIGGAHVADALAATRRSPHVDVAPQPDQAVLEQIQAVLAGGLAA
jgi:hypothetical protein